MLIVVRALQPHWWRAKQQSSGGRMPVIGPVAKIIATFDLVPGFGGINSNLNLNTIIELQMRPQRARVSRQKLVM